MQTHAEPHKIRNGDYSSQDRLDFSYFFKKLVNKHGTCGTVSLGAKNHNAETKVYNPKVYNKTLPPLRYAPGAPTPFRISKSCSNSISNV